MATLWRTDGRGRLDAPHHLVVGAAADGHTTLVGAAVPDRLAATLRRTVASDPVPTAPGQPPPSLRQCQALLRQELGPVELSSGPSYLVPTDVRYDADATVVQSGSPDAATLHQANPGNWEPDEWADLLAGKLGPWAMVVAGTTVVSICHTPASSSHGAEAGTWTRPDRRGRGYAAAATAAWASLFTGGQQLFYSTSAANQSSQRVAARLNLRLIGWLWKVSPASQP